MKVSSHFDSGNIEVISLESHQDIQLSITSDSNSHFFQWFHFRLMGAKDKACVIRLLNASESAYTEGWENYRPVASYDREEWFRVSAEYDGKELSIHHTPTSDSVYYAYFEPYSCERHENLISYSQTSDYCQAFDIGTSLDKRDLTGLRISNSNSDKGEGSKLKIWIIARQHPGETMAEWFMEGLIGRLLDDSDPVSRTLLDNMIFYVVPNMNPDGSYRGNLRTNAAGMNLNREWLSPSMEKSPEVCLVRELMHKTKVDLFLDIHGDEALPYNFVAACEGNPSYNEHIQYLEQQFKQLFLKASPDFQTTHGYPIDQPGTANLSKATNYVGETFNCLAFTLEMPFKDNVNLPDMTYGWSSDRSMKLGEAILLPICQLMDELRN